MVDMKLIEQQFREAPSEEVRLELFLERSMSSYRAHPKEALKWAQQAQKLAKQLGRALDEARAMYRVGCAQFQMSQLEAARLAFENTAEYYASDREGAKYLDAPLFMLGQIEQLRGNLTNANAHFERTLEARRQLQKNNIWEVLNSLGLVSLYGAQHAKALSYLFDALEYAEAAHHDLGRAITLTNIGSVFLDIRDNIRAADYFERAYRIERSIQDGAPPATTLCNLASLASEQHQFDQATVYCRQALTFAKDPSSAHIMPYAKAILGEIELKQNNRSAAITYLTEALEHADTLGLKSLAAEIRANLAEAYLLPRKQPKRAIEILAEVVTFATDSHQGRLEVHARELLARAYQYAGDLKKSVAHYELYIQRNEALLGQERQRAIVEVQARVEIEKLERDRKRMEVLAQNAERRAHAFAEENERQSNELTALALQLVQKNEFLAELREKINDRNPGSDTLLREIDDHVRSDQDWEVFENQLNQVHGDFLKRLSALYSQLTPMELKTAALLKLDLSSKAIANLFCVSVRTVENHRLSLRKKIGLAPESNLTSFLAAL
jgi:tetratricopeptide (TPR) repeat protein